jgi:hypothetical protein
VAKFTNGQTSVTAATAAVADQNRGGGQWDPSIGTATAVRADRGFACGSFQSVPTQNMSSITKPKKIQP